MAKNMNKTHKKTINDYIIHYRKKYKENEEVIEGLYILLDETKKGIQTKYPEEDILSAIERKYKEQQHISRQLRKCLNAKYRNKMVVGNQEQTTKYLKSNVNNKKLNTSTTTELVKSSKLGDYIKNPIYKDKEIIIETNIVNKYVSDVIVTTPEQKNKPKPVTNILNSIRTRKNTIKEFPNAKVVFDGQYKIICDGETKFSEPIDDVLLEYNYSEKNAKNNINIIRMLERFDEKYRSNLCNKYRNGELKVYYDLMQYASLKDDAYTKKQMEKVAKKDAKHNRNVNIIKEKKIDKLKVGLSAIAAAALVTLGSLGIVSKLNKNKNTNISTGTTVEYQVDNKTEEAYTLSNTEMTTEKATEATTEITTEELTTEVTTQEKIVTTEEVKVEPIVETKEEVKTEPIVETKIEEKEEFDLKIGDTVSLDNIDLYYSSTDELPVGNTSNLEGYTYKASLISVTYQGNVMELVYNDNISLSELEKVCKEKYGNDVEIKINYSAIDNEGNVYTDYVGWTNATDVKTKSKVLK